MIEVKNQYDCFQKSDTKCAKKGTKNIITVKAVLQCRILKAGKGNVNG